ncbi:MAG: Gfo/Idh/MocA family oxidoreductase, partial [Actinobacteria bacterium]|nr:Gfo/Idh/MocA family oxidoreductase [Actinomycetota bacterium]
MSNELNNALPSGQAFPLNVVIVGASHRSTMMYKFLEKYPSYGKVVGIYDKVLARAKYLVEQYGLSDAIIYESLEQAVSAPKAQVVFVSTADGEHVKPVVAALKAGKHVFCEKPMAITLEDCDTII